MTVYASNYSNQYSNTNLDKMVNETLQKVSSENANQLQSISDESVFTQNPTNSTTSAKDANCADGKDDGKIGFFSAIGNMFKGAVNMVVNTVKDVLTDPKKLIMAVGMAALCAVCPPAGLVMAGVGIVTGGAKVLEGVDKAANAKTDAEAEAAFQEIGEGGLTVGMSVAGAKASVKAMGPDSAVGSGLMDGSKVKLSKAFSKKTEYTMADGSTATGLKGFGKAMWNDTKTSTLGQKVSSFKESISKEAQVKAEARIDKGVENYQKKIDETPDSVKTADKTRLEDDLKTAEQMKKDAVTDADKTAAKEMFDDANKNMKDFDTYQSNQKQLDALQNRQKLGKTGANRSDYQDAMKDHFKGSSKLNEKAIENSNLSPSAKGELQDILTTEGKITGADIKALNLSADDAAALKQLTGESLFTTAKNGATGFIKNHGSDMFGSYRQVASFELGNELNEKYA